MEISKLLNFVRERYEPASKWSDETLRNYIYWSLEHDFIFVARGDDDEIQGVALARPVRELPQSGDFTTFDKGGDTTFIDVMIAANERAFLLLGFTILEAFSGSSVIAFHRTKGSEDARIYTSKHVRQTLFKLRKKFQQ